MIDATVRAQVAQDKARQRSWIQKRERARAMQDTQARVGDIDRNGDVIPEPRYKVFGWRTNSEDEDGEAVYVNSPAEAGLALERLLNSGCWSMVVYDSRHKISAE